MRQLGLIVEDQSDADVLGELVKQIARKRFAVRSIRADGCGRMVAKCQAWAKGLLERGCTLLILARDSDKGDAQEIASGLQKALNPCPIEHYVIVVPVREIEAWLLADHAAVTKGVGLLRPLSKQANPEAITDPKARLAHVVHERSQGTKRYLNTIHNKKIAAHLNLNSVRGCRSFKPFEAFVKAHLG